MIEVLQQWCCRSSYTPVVDTSKARNALQGKAKFTKLLVQQQAQRARKCVMGIAEHYRAT